MTPAEESRKRRNYDAFQSSRDKSISPPPKRHAASVCVAPQMEEKRPPSAVKPAAFSVASSENGKGFSQSTHEQTTTRAKNLVKSPVQLNFIEELPASSNVDCISLGSILGDPMIKECWLFNYLFDLDFVMKHFDQDTRDIVQVRAVHGFWKREDPNRVYIEDAEKRYPNIKTIKAYMPEMFGTHHTKAIVLFRHDDLAQVVILTANFVEGDFHMSQAVWKTPLLPLQIDGQPSSDLMPPLGSGPRFKHDLLAYFRGYGRNGNAILSDLISQLQAYDFSAVRGALIGSLPGLQMPGQFEPEEQDRIGRWGLPALKHVLSSIPTSSPSSADPDAQSHIMAQVSSIASIGEKWLLSTLIPTLSTIKRPLNPPTTPHPKPKISIIFPTAATIRNSIGGYSAGSSIHIKTTSPAQAKQLSILKPMLCHWSKPDPFPTPNHHNHNTPKSPSTNRGPAAPHIKTYIRFSSAASLATIDWALLTSANLSTQAWGTNPNNDRGEVKISSYELGVLFWPALWDDDDPARPSSTSKPPATMVPVFGSDMPPSSSFTNTNDTTKHALDPGNAKEEEGQVEGVKVGWRMAYDLPLIPYAPDEKPWCASEPCEEPDWMGRLWPGFGR